MLDFGLVFFYFYYLMPFLLIYVLIYDKEYISFVAASACVISLFLLLVFFPREETVLTGSALYISYTLSLLNVIYVLAFITYKLNEKFRVQYFPRLFVLISVLNLLLISL